MLVGVISVGLGVQACGAAGVGGMGSMGGGMMNGG